MTEERKTQLLGNLIYWATEVINNDEEIVNMLHKSIGFTKKELEEFDVDIPEGYFERHKSYPHIDECEDAWYFKNNLTPEGLDLLESILENHRNGNIELIVPRDFMDDINFDGEWKVKVKDNSHEPTEAEVAVLKWYEGYEDTGYLTYVIQDAVNPAMENVVPYNDEGMRLEDFIDGLEQMYTGKDKTCILNWVRYLSSVHNSGEFGDFSMEEEMRDIYLSMCYVRNNFDSNVLESCLENPCMAQEIVNEAMAYQAGWTNSDINNLMGEDRLVSGYIPKTPNEKGSLSVIKVGGMDDRIFIVENENADRVLDGVNCAGTVHLLSGVGVDKIIMQSKLCGLNAKGICDNDLIRAIQATCAGSTAIDTMTVYNPGNNEIEQRKTEGMTAKEVDTFLHPQIGGEDESYSNTMDMGGF